jgi:hypothetical protein
MVAACCNVVEQRVQPPAPGHSSLETMTQQDYSNDLVFRSSGEEYACLDGSGQWKPVTPSTELEIADGNITPSIIFNIGPAPKEIARFTEEGFYYKGEFIDDAGEVHRLLKEVLGQMKAEQACDDVVPKAVPYVELISDDELSAIYETLVKGCWGENKQPGEEPRMYGFARTVLAAFKAR